MRKLKIALMALMTAFMITCTTTELSTASYRDHHPVSQQITSKLLTEQCVAPEGIYNLTHDNFVMEARMSHHLNCLGVNEMLVFMWPGQVSLVDTTAGQLAVYMWAEWVAAKNPNTVITVGKIKRDSIEVKGKNINMLFFEVTRTKQK